MAISLAELAAAIGAELRGDPDITVHQIATLIKATAGDVSFLSDPAYRKHLRVTGASAVILAPEHAGDCPVAALVLANPYLGYARASAVLHPKPAPRPGRAASAAVSPTARVAASAEIGPAAVVEQGALVGEGVIIGPGAVVGAGARVGAHTRVLARAVLCHGVVIGSRCIIHPGAVIGSDGFGLALSDGRWRRIEQIGGVRLGDEVDVGANSTIDRGALEDTVIEDGVKIDNLVQIGHNVRIGEHSALAGCVGIAGSASIGRRCMLGGGVGIAGHLALCDDVIVTGMSLVTKSITRPGSYSGGWPARETRSWRRDIARIRRLIAEG